MGGVGTVAAHRALGVRVVLLFLTRGEMTESLGPLSADEVGAARVPASAQEIARILDCEVRFLDFKDTHVEYNSDASHRVGRVIAEIKPDAVITWGDAWTRGRRHPDHKATGEIVRAAVTIARMKRAVKPLEPHRAPAPIFTVYATATPCFRPRPSMSRNIRTRSSRSRASTASVSAGRRRSLFVTCCGVLDLPGAWRRGGGFECVRERGWAAQLAAGGHLPP